MVSRQKKSRGRALGVRKILKATEQKGPNAPMILHVDLLFRGSSVGTALRTFLQSRARVKANFWPPARNINGGHTIFAFDALSLFSRLKRNLIKQMSLQKTQVTKNRTLDCLLLCLQN